MGHANFGTFEFANSIRPFSVQGARGAIRPAYRAQKLSAEMNVELMGGQEVFGRHMEGMTSCGNASKMSLHSIERCRWRLVSSQPQHQQATQQHPHDEDGEQYARPGVFLSLSHTCIHLEEKYAQRRRGRRGPP
jgi:hypothetical protein